MQFGAASVSLRPPFMGMCLITVRNSRTAERSVKCCGMAVRIVKTAFVKITYCVRGGSRNGENLVCIPQH
jgi:hypothetical protein